MKYLKAFTIIELLVVMVLASIIFGFALTAIQLSSSQLQKFQQQNETSNNLIHCQSLLSWDIENAHSLIANNNSLTCENKTQNIQYLFDGNRMIRIPLGIEHRQDTFKLVVREMNFYFKNSLIQSGLTDQVIVVIEHENEPIEMKLNKHYSPATLINNK